MRFIGLDIGTTGCKAHVFNASGKWLGGASREYAIDIPHPDWAEQDAENVWKLAQQVPREANEATGIDDDDVAAIGLSCQGEAVIPVDVEGNALRPAILGMDTRTDEQNAWLIKWSPLASGLLTGKYSAGDRETLPDPAPDAMPTRATFIKSRKSSAWIRKFLLGRASPDPDELQDSSPTRGTRHPRPLGTPPGGIFISPQARLPI